MLGFLVPSTHRSACGRGRPRSISLFLPVGRKLGHSEADSRAGTMNDLDVPFALRRSCRIFLSSSCDDDSKRTEFVPGRALLDSIHLLLGSPSRITSSPHPVRTRQVGSRNHCSSPFNEGEGLLRRYLSGLHQVTDSLMRGRVQRTIGSSDRLKMVSLATSGGIGSTSNCCCWVRTPITLSKASHSSSVLNLGTRMENRPTEG